MEERIEQPVLLVGQLRYAKRDTCDSWDLWSAFFEWSVERGLEEILTTGGDPKGRVVRATILARALYSASSIEDVVRAMETVRRSATSVLKLCRSF